MNITISVDAELLERARRMARQRGASVQELLRDHLRALAGARSHAEVADELLALMSRKGGRSGGRPFRREDAYRGRV